MNIESRDDVSPQEGKQEYGDVAFADSVNSKYPVDTPKHVRAAWSYIHHQNNAAKYKTEEVEIIKKHIRSAAKKHGVELDDNQ